MAQYGSAEYWNSRYAKDPEPFDWYQRYAGLRPIFSQYLQRGQRILVAGCGNSRLTEELHDDGFTDIVSVDLSPTVIAAMRARYGRERPSLAWHVGNVTALGASGVTVADASLGAVVDKGTLDSLLCGEAATAQAARYVAEAARVLRPGGTFLVVSFGRPDSRLAHLDKAVHRWTVTVHRVPKPSLAGVVLDTAATAAAGGDGTAAAAPAVTTTTPPATAAEQPPSASQADDDVHFIYAW